MVRAGADFSSMKREIDRANKNLSNFKSSVSKTMKGLGALLAATGLGFGIRAATRDAMQFEAALQQIDRMMGNNAKQFNAWVKTSAAGYGMARSEATRYGAVFANLISGFTTGTQQTAQYTEDLLKASAVIASSTGRTIEDTMDRIRSGMLGSTEAIEDLGINVNVSMIEATDAFKQFAGHRSWQQLDFNTQQTIRYFAILEQAATKYGLELAQNTTSRQAAFVAQLKNAQLALGQAFLPIYNSVLPALTRMATALANAMNVVAQFTQALFGGNQTNQAKATEAQASAVGELGDAYEEAGKQAKGAVSGFDQINLVGGTTPGAGGIDETLGLAPEDTSAQTGALQEVSEAMSDVARKAREMASRVKSAYGEVSAFIRQHSEIIIAALAGVGVALGIAFGVAKWGGIVSAVKAAASAVGVVIAAIGAPITLIVAAIAGLVAAFVYFYRTNEQFKDTVHNILAQIGETAAWLWSSVLVPFGQWLGTVFVAAWGYVTSAANWLWQNVLAPFGNFLRWLWQSVLAPIGRILIDVLGVAFRFVADVAKDFWQKVLVPLGKALSEMFGPAVRAVSTVLKVLWEKVMKPFGSFLVGIFKRDLVNVTKAFEFLWYNVLKPLAAFVGGVLKITFTNAFDTIGQVINGVKNIFIGLMNFISGVFTNDWRMAWDGVRQIFKGIFDSLWAIVKFPMNLIIDAINKVINGLNKFSIDIPDWVGTLAGIQSGKFGINIPKIPKLAGGGVARGPTLAVVGDNHNARVDPEVIAPLSQLESMIGNDNKDVVRAIERVERAVQSIERIQAVITRSEVGRAAIDYIKSETARGRNPLPQP